MSLVPPDPSRQQWLRRFLAFLHLGMGATEIIGIAGCVILLRSLGDSDSVSPVGIAFGIVTVFVSLPLMLLLSLLVVLNVVVGVLLFSRAGRGAVAGITLFKTLVALAASVAIAAAIAGISDVVALPVLLELAVLGALVTGAPALVGVTTAGLALFRTGFLGD